MKVHVFTRNRPHPTLGEIASCMFASSLCLAVWGVRRSEKYSVGNQTLLGSVATRNGNQFERLVSDRSSL